MNVKNYFVASNIDEAYEKLLEHDQNIIVGGGAWLRLSNKEIETLIDLSALDLNRISETDQSIEIGASATLRDVEEYPKLQSLFNGIVSKSMKSIMGVGIRNLATIGGSVAGKYSFSDILTPLLALETYVVLHKGGTVPLDEFMKLRGQEKDIITKIIIMKSDAKCYYYKMKKSGLDFAVINVAVSKLDSYKITVGARPSVAILATEAMEYINNQSDVTDEVIEKTADVIKETIKFGTNSKASKEYRKEIASVYVKRGIKEVA